MKLMELLLETVNPSTELLDAFRQVYTSRGLSKRSTGIPDRKLLNQLVRLGVIDKGIADERGGGVIYYVDTPNNVELCLKFIELIGMQDSSKYERLRRYLDKKHRGDI